jgi:RNA polymerase sigma factor (sigma-70 family)
MNHSAIAEPRPFVLVAQSDERLVRHARAGDERAFAAIVDRYRPALVRYCARIVGDARAEDAVQQVLLDAYVALAGGTQVRALKPWLYRIAHNTSLNVLRERVSGELPDELGDAGSAAQVAESREELGRILRAVQALPPRQRDAIVLRELEGRSYDEIASELGVGDGAVRQLLNRARNAVRAGIAALSPFGALLPIGETPAAMRLTEMVTSSSPAAKAATGAMLAGAVGFIAPAPHRPAPPPRVHHVRRPAPKPRAAPPPRRRAVSPPYKAAYKPRHKPLYKPARRPAARPRPRPSPRRAAAPPPRRRPGRPGA